MVAGRTDWPLPRNLRAGGRYDGVAWTTPTHGKRTTGAVSAESAGTPRISGVALRRANADGDHVCARSFWDDPGRVLSPSVITAEGPVPQPSINPPPRWDTRQC